MKRAASWCLLNIQDTFRYAGALFNNIKMHFDFRDFILYKVTDYQLIESIYYESNDSGSR